MSKLIDFRYVLIALSTVFAIGIAALMGLQINRAREEAVATGLRDIRNLANNLAQHTRQSFRAVDLVMESLSSPELAPQFLDPTRKAASSTALRRRVQTLPGVLSIFVLGADGHLIASSLQPDPEPIDLSNSRSFTSAREGEDFVISPPVVSKEPSSEGKLVLVLARRIESRDGKFLGTLEATLGLDYFSDFYQNLDIGPQGVIGVTRRDGVVLIRYPLGAGRLGRSSIDSPVFQAYKQGAGQGDLFATYVSDNIMRMVAYRDIPDLDVFITVGMSLDDILRSWKRSAVIESGNAIAVILLLALLTFLANRLLSAREAEQARLASRLNRLAAASADIAAIHTGAGLADGMRRMVRDLIPGGEAEIRFALERSGVSRAPLIEARAITVPLQTKGGRILGTLHVTRTEGSPLTTQDAAVLSQLGLIGTVALENVELLAQSRRLAAQAEQARVEEAEARHRIEDVFATMSEGVYTLDHESRFSFLNDNAVKMLMRSREELLGQVISDVFPNVRGTALEEQFARVFAEQVAAEFEFEYETNDGTRWVDVRAFPVEEGITVYIRDITQRVETDNKLRQSQKMEAIGQLTGGIAHDFNNLLTVVLGNVDTLVGALEHDKRLRRVAEIARDAATRGATLVARLLAFARRQALAPRAIDINVLTHSLEDLLGHTIGETLKIEFKRADDLWRANIDPTQMENALLNLALNARDAMPRGGTLTIETANTGLGEEPTDDSPIVAGEYVMVAVSDTGTGMTANVRSRAFDPFFTTKPVGEGSGLGLSMVYGFVRQSGGYVRIDSELGQGTTVRMYLPRAQISTAPRPAALETHPPPSGNETIMVVEDDELVREHVCETLKGLGYVIIPCGTGREAIDLVQRGADADLLLTDVMLAGGINGHSVAESVKKLRPNIPVLYMSGYAEQAIGPGGNIEAGIHFIAKPFRRQDIAAKLRDVLSGTTPHGS